MSAPSAGASPEIAANVQGQAPGRPTAEATALAPAQATRLVATSFLSLFAIVGLVLYGLPAYYDHFVKDLHWARGDVLFGNFFGKVFVGPIFGLLAGWLIDRQGPRRSMMAGLLFAGAAVACLGQLRPGDASFSFTVPFIGLMQVFPYFLFCYFLNALGYVFAGPLPNQVLLSRTFKQARGRAMGIAYLGIGIGAFFVPQISKALIASFGWRTALMVLGGIVVAVGMPLVLALREGDGASAPAAAQARVPLGDVLRNRNFYLLAIGSMASIGAVGGAQQTLKLLLTIDQHRPEAVAFNILSVIAGISLAGRLGAGALADRLGPKRVMLIVYGLVTVAALILVSGAGGNSIYAFAAIFGLGQGGEYLIIPLMAAELFGTAVLGRVMGLIVTADGMAEALFPWVVNKIHDHTHSYALGFRLLAGLAILGAVAILLLPRSRPRT